MWAAISALGYFLNHDVHDGIWMEVSDRPRVIELAGLIGCAILSALNTLDRLEELKEDSAFRDLGIVMALFLKFSQDIPTGPIYINEGVETDWQEAIIQYAAKAGIEVTDQGVTNIEDLVDDCESTGVPISGKATASRWHWTKTVSEQLSTTYYLANADCTACILP